MTKTKIYGHRGCKGTLPENTLIGFRKAIELGVDGIEIDVHMTKDGEIVVIHDERLERTTDGSGFIKDLSLAEIKQYRAGSKFMDFALYEESTWGLEQVPTLQELLELLMPYDIELNIEFKTYLFDYKGIEEKVLSLVNQFGNNRKVVYSSFHLPTLLSIKNIEPTANIAWLLFKKISHPKNYMEILDLESLHLHKDILLSEKDQLQEMVRNIRVWTVNDPSEIKFLLDLGVEAIVTDFPEEALRLRNERILFA